MNERLQKCSGVTGHLACDQPRDPGRGTCVRGLAGTAGQLLQGPLGSPQRQQPDAGIWTSRPGAPADTANTESCFSSASLLQEGHCAAREPFTIASNACPHSRQTYSNIGMRPV